MALKSIANSLVLSRDDFTYLDRTFSVPTNSNRWTLSLWFKRGRNIPDGSAVDTIFSAGADASNFTRISFEANDTLRFEFVEAAATIDDVVTTATFRDPTAWYHLVVRYNSDEVVATDRIRFWVDNVQITDFSTSNFPALGDDSDINVNTFIHNIGRTAGPNNNFFDGYLSDIFFCDGQTLSPTDFAEDDNGTWQPIAPSVTFGNNGFLLEFGTAADLGNDTGTIGTNNWTENVIVAANQRNDTPTRNHLTWNNQYFGINDTITLRNGSRQMLAANSAYVTAFATAALPRTGKYYWEVDWAAGATAVDEIVVGVVDQLAALDGKVGNDNHGWGVYNPTGTTIAIRHDSGDTNFTDTGAFAVGDYLMVAYNADNGKLWFGRNGTFFDSGDPGADTGEHVTLTAADIFGRDLIPAGSIVTTNNRLDFRAGAEDFEGAIPTGFNSLSTVTWPNPAVVDPKDYFDLIAYAGDDSTPRTHTGLQFEPAIVWIKATDGGTDHLITDTIKGAGFIHSNDLGSSDVAANSGGEVSAFNSDGFTTVNNATGFDVNVANPRDYIGFCWKEDVAAGLDLVGYAGAAAPQAVSHSLGAVPEVMYVRNRTEVFANIALYHGVLIDGAGAPLTDPETDYLRPDLTSALTDDIATWNDVAPTTVDFTVGSLIQTNTLGDNHAAFIWRGVEGLSKFVSYAGTGTDDANAPFIYCGFRPKLVFIKVLDVAAGWRMFVRDNADIGLGAPGGTDSTQYWQPDADSPMVTPGGSGISADFCASGFKIRQVDGFTNAAGNEYMVMAFAEVPFQFKSALQTPPVGAGALDLAIDVTATGDDPNQFGAGAMDLKILISASGTGGLPKADAAPDLALQIDGTGTAPFTLVGSGAMDLKLAISATGRGQPAARGDGAVALAIEIDSDAFNTAIRGSPVLPQLTTVASAVQSFDTQGSAILPNLVMGAVTILNANPIFGFPRIPVLATSGEINPDFDVDLPILQVDGTILTGTTLRGLATLPLIQPSGSGISPPVVSGFIILPQLGTGGSTILAGAAITAPGVDVLGASTLPALEANGFLLIPQEMAGIITLPALDLDPLSFLAPGAIVTGSVTLPLLRLEAILVNGVTLTGTVWSMNTETLETTNYLNFDFVSLVSFADQPYGVTAGGIFLLEGDDDDGTTIDARVLTGISDRGNENLTEVAHSYMQYDGGAMMFQLFPDGQQRLREYRFERRSNSSGVIHARAKGSRGLRSRSWQMGLRNLGGDDFTLDKLGLLLRQLTRNTRKN